MTQVDNTGIVKTLGILGWNDHVSEELPDFKWLLMEEISTVCHIFMIVTHSALVQVQGSPLEMNWVDTHVYLSIQLRNGQLI